jgi:hypothetical protein
MKKLWGVALVVAALCACSGDSSNSVAGGVGTSSNHTNASGSSTNYGGASTGSNASGGGSTVDTCGCDSTQECCLMSGSSNTFGCVPMGTCPSGMQKPPPGSDSGTTAVDSGGNPPPTPACTGSADCSGQVCCATANGGPTSATCRATCNNGRVQVCADVNDCPQGDSCNRIGFGQNAVMECVAPQPPPPMDAGMDAARPDAAAEPDAAADSGTHDAATPDAADGAPHDAATGG